LVGNGMRRVKKDGISVLIMDSNPVASCGIINLCLVLIRYNFIHSNLFYKVNAYLSLIMSIHSIISMILSILTFGTFEVLFKQISIVNYSINIYSYLLISSLMLSILLILLTNHALFHFGTLIYSQQEYKISNQVTKKNVHKRFFFI
jgi:hypothetical protein